MKTLGNLKPNKGSNQRKKRLGRGIGSGLGKTAGKGHKGQLARKGPHIRAGFEGGQMPLYRRLPKRGFKNHFRKQFDIVNLVSLNKFEANAKITPETLFEKGLITEAGKYIKLLGKGKLEKNIQSISVHKISATAKAAIEKAGGKVEMLTIFTKKKPKRKFVAKVRKIPEAALGDIKKSSDKDAKKKKPAVSAEVKKPKSPK